MTLCDIRGPEDLRSLTQDQLSDLAAEIRRLLIDNVCRTGGHLGPNLGVVELTLALHRVFDSPYDRILWDTGHQAYVHKIVTGRAADFDGLRQRDGLSGYPSRAESEHDYIENSHASTALSYADGLAKADQLLGNGDRARVVAVVGDGALTGGMAWEALNNIGGARGRNVIIVLNDNGRSYAPTVGGLARHLAALRTGDMPRCLFENLGLGYLGPVDGHDIAGVEAALRRARTTGGPVVVHCVTTKGAGYALAEQNEVDRLHAVRPMDSVTGQPLAPAAETWTGVFAQEIVRLGAERPDIVALTAAMLEPTGLEAFANAYPDRVFDVGIAEQHAVGSAAGLAMGGLHPVVAVYSTFLNRAFDQVLMDVALCRLPVTFVLDRAGITGEDGPSHHGMWDLSVLQVVPGLRLAVPRDGVRLRELLREAVDDGDGPTAVRFPKGAAGGELAACRSYGTMDVLRDTAPGAPGRDGVLLVAVGAMAGVCVAIAELLAAQGIATTVVDPRWVKPLHPSLAELAREHRLVAVVEDNGRVGGVGDAVARLLRESAADVAVTTFGIPRRFLQHGARSEILAECGLTPRHIATAIIDALTSGAQAPDLELVPTWGPR